MNAAGIANGHVTIADWLFLAAMILFLIAAVLSYAGAALGKVNNFVLLCVGLAAVSLAWLLL